MTVPGPRILAVGDPFVPADVFVEALAALPSATVSTLQIEDYTPAGEGAETDGRPAIGEYVGSPNQLIDAVADAEVLLVHAAPVTAAVLEAGSELRIVGCARGGPINVDVAAATARGVSVLRAPGRNARAVAELTLCLMIALARNVKPAMARAAVDPELGASVIEGARFLGTELAERVVGLIGLGRVGALVARTASDLGMTVLGYDPLIDDERMTELGVAKVSLDELLSASDIVSLHARAIPETENLIGAAEFAAMRDGSLFVNTARETLVDEEALIDTLESGRLQGAALDVVRPRSSGRSPLLDRDDVIVLPHVGGATREAGLNGVKMLVEATVRLLAGEEVTSVVNPEAEPRSVGG